MQKEEALKRWRLKATPSLQSMSLMAFNFGSTTVSVAESLALCNGLIDAKRRGFKKVEVEGDSKLAIDVINGIFAPLEIAQALSRY
ncbi:hypothetical protein ACLB2K_045946 [Fragaria x ananassa]